MTRSLGRAASAPLFSDAFALCQWLLGRLGDRRDVLSERICAGALSLLEHTVLALKGIDREVHIDDAERALVLVRVQLRLAEATDALTEAQVLHALTIADRMGRQLGGWQRSVAGYG